MKEVYDFLKRCETYYLATVEGDQPRVRPLEGKWLRIEAVVVEDERREAKQYMLDQYPSLKATYSAAANTQVLYLKDATATFSSITEAPRVVNF